MIGFATRRDIELHIMGVIGFALTVYFLPFIEQIISGFVGYDYVPKILAYAVSYILLIYAWPRVLWKIYDNLM